MEIFEARKDGRIQILIADELPMYGDSLRALLERQPDFSVVGVAPDGLAAVQMSQEQKPDVLLLNVKVAGQDGMGVLDSLKNLNVRVRPLLLATSLSGSDLMRALMLGACGVVLKTSPSQRLVDGIRGVMVGQYWIGDEMGPSMMRALQEYARVAKEGRPKAFGLTNRELEIVGSVVAGYTNAEIASKYGLSRQTVKHHLSSVFDKVGVYNRVELALFAVNHQLVQDQA